MIDHPEKELPQICALLDSVSAFLQSVEWNDRSSEEGAADLVARIDEALESQLATALRECQAAERDAQDMQEQRDSARKSYDTMSAACKFNVKKRSELECTLRVALRERDALQVTLEDLYALVRGESPRLLNEDSGGDGALALRISQLLSGSEKR